MTIGLLAIAAVVGWVLAFVLGLLIGRGTAGAQLAQAQREIDQAVAVVKEVVAGAQDLRQTLAAIGRPAQDGNTLAPKAGPGVENEVQSMQPEGDKVK